MKLKIKKFISLLKTIKGFLNKMGNKDILGFGKDNDSTAQPIGIAGEENNELVTISIEEMMLFQKILRELKKLNEQLEIMTNTKLHEQDARGYRDKD